ncbi:uncharacterized protein LOC127723373 [Mytilus californianus]|uniref:uncharacterized protein LOC127723373 n=1 Tax=Mytilus californianus TaxID=6549 RepID=UPI0022470112|nr:uncharacterized protein LOC127723373 [Mytilus californianus]
MMGLYRKNKTILLTLILIIVVGLAIVPAITEIVFKTVHTISNSHDISGEHRKNATIHIGGNIGKQDLKKTKTISMFLKKPCPANIISDTDIRYSQAKQDVTVYKLLKIQNGYFIEIGGFDGKTWSNTLWLERRHNWTGLLIEADPDNCDAIDKLGRNIWRLCSCLSSLESKFFLKKGAEGSSYTFIPKERVNTVDMSQVIFVPCFHISEILKSIKQFRINYFSLDVEGAEMEVLENMKKDIQLKTLIVDVWTIEYRVWDGKKIILEKSMYNLAKLRYFFQEVGGYIEHSQLSNTNDVADGLALDVVFINLNTWCRAHETKPDGSKCDR